MLSWFFGRLMKDPTCHGMCSHEWKYQEERGACSPNLSFFQFSFRAQIVARCKQFYHSFTPLLDQASAFLVYQSSAHFHGYGIRKITSLLQGHGPRTWVPPVSRDVSVFHEAPSAPCASTSLPDLHLRPSAQSLPSQALLELVGR